MTAQLRLVENTGTALRASPSPSQFVQRTYLYGDEDSSWSAYSGMSGRAFASSMQSILEELGRLRNGWHGAGSVAPNPAVVTDIQLLAPMLPLGTRLPEVEVDASDGEVRLRWRAEHEPKSIAISLVGDGKARVIQTILTGSVQNPFIEIALSRSQPNRSGRILQQLEHSGLFVGE